MASATDRRLRVGGAAAIVAAAAAWAVHSYRLPSAPAPFAPCAVPAATAFDVAVSGAHEGALDLSPLAKQGVFAPAATAETFDVRLRWEPAAQAPDGEVFAGTLGGQVSPGPHYWWRLRPDCGFGGLIFAGGLAEADRRQLLYYHSLLDLRVASLRDEWSLPQNDLFGRHDAHYAWADGDHGSILRTKRRYQTSEGAAEVKVQRATAVFRFAPGEPLYRQATVEERFLIRLEGRTVGESRASLAFTVSPAQTARGTPPSPGLPWLMAGDPVTTDSRSEPPLTTANLPTLASRDLNTLVLDWRAALGRGEKPLHIARAMLAYVRSSPEAARSLWRELRARRLDDLSAHAFWALGAAGGDEARRVLEEAVADPALPYELAAQAVHALAEIPDPTESALRRIRDASLGKTGNPDVADTALLALGAAGSRLPAESPLAPLVHDELEERLAAAGEAPAKLTLAMAAAANTQDARYLDGFAAQAGHEDPVVRRQAVRALSGYDDPRSTRALVSVVRSGADPVTLREAAKTVSPRLGEGDAGREQRALLVAALDESTPPEQAAAIVEAVGRHAASDPAVRDALLRYAKDAPLEVVTVMGRYLRADELLATGRFGTRR